MATVHPSSILRAPDENTRREETARFIADLKNAAEYLKRWLRRQRLLDITQGGHILSRSHGYPRPMLERPEWVNLNGPWDFAIDADARWSMPDQVDWKSDDSGSVRAGNTRQRHRKHRLLIAPSGTAARLNRRSSEMNKRLIIHFGAVDHSATVWVNGKMAVEHEGGYTPFSADITDFLTGEGPQTMRPRL